ncbi:unnamed protein product [Brassicogethes aeneus]|uniref:Homeobox domain-containing protein n=1 Tax=Brassicogethes aeneus TaxID=1431903 RepID=A0A9P0AY98_BRAAE|nr:unnamed protein product [Brassicogethes aeneus]
MISQMDQKDEVVKHSDFSIDHILNRAGNSQNSDDEARTSVNYSLDPYSWLQCTRYCPPKIPRVPKREGPQKRQLGRHPRIPFTSHQLSILEEKFQQTPYLSSEEVIKLSNKLDLADIRVKIWFQNRRARERREKTSTEIKQEERKSPVKSEENIRVSPSTSPMSMAVRQPSPDFTMPTLIYNPFLSNPFLNSYSLPNNTDNENR